MIRFWFLLTFVIASLFSVAQGNQTLQPKAISKLLPIKVPGYAVKGESKSSILTIGTLRYSLCERVFATRDRTIKILLFDYVEAPVMLSQSIKKWSAMPTVETDSITFASHRTEYGERWISSHPRSKRAQLLLSINNRFFLTLEAEGITITELEEFAARHIDLANFPK